MKKILLIVIILIFIMSLVTQEDKEIRVRVIPNSNTVSDLVVKEDVKNSVIYYLLEIYNEDYDVYKENIKKSIYELESIIDENFEDCNVDFGYHTLYNKTYNGNKLKDKRTLLLQITLGEGEGDNWWGSIYPKYLSISSDENVEYKSLFVTLIKKVRGDKDED